MRDALLTAIFKAVHENSVSESYLGIYSTDAKDRTGCGIPRFTEFRSLPVNVQDDLMRADILPTMWPQYKISGYERVFHDRLMTVIRRAMLCSAACHTLSPGVINNMYPDKIDQKHRKWIKDLIHVQGSHPDPVGELVLSAYECATSILQSTGATRCNSVQDFHAHQLDLFLFKDMGLGGGVHCCSSREAELQAAETGVTLQEFLENGTTGDIVEQRNKKDNTYWLQANDFFFGHNGDFTTVREVSESSHDIIMGDFTSSDVSAMDVDSLDASAPQAGTEEPDEQPPAESVEHPAAAPAAAAASSASGQRPGMVVGAEVAVHLLAIEDVKSEDYYRASDQIRGAVDQLGEQLQQNMEEQAGRVGPFHRRVHESVDVM